MPRKKLRKLKEVRSLPNVIESTDESLFESLQKYFGNKKLFTFELGCGDGDFTRELARKDPDKNFIGVDLKGSRIWNAANAALQSEITNAVFIISKAERLKEILPPVCAEEIILPFPDPHVKRKSAPRRLVSHQLMEVYKHLLMPGGKVHLKTDNPILFEFAVNVLNELKIEIVYLSEDLYRSDISNSITEIRSRYENHYLSEGRIIKYACFKFSD